MTCRQALMIHHWIGNYTLWVSKVFGIDILVASPIHPLGSIKLPGVALTGQREHSQTNNLGYPFLWHLPLFIPVLNVIIMHCTQTDRMPCQTYHIETSVSWTTCEFFAVIFNNQIWFLSPLIQPLRLATRPSIRCLNKNEPITKSSLTWDHVILSANNHPLPSQQ